MTALLGGLKGVYHMLVTKIRKYIDLSLRHPRTERAAGSDGHVLKRGVASSDSWKTTRLSLSPAELTLPLRLEAVNGYI